VFILLIVFEIFTVIILEKSEEDIKLDKIGKLLELGGTMLANHCECGAPLFRYHGNVICPICDSNSKEAIKSQEKTSRKPEENHPGSSDQVTQAGQAGQVTQAGQVEQVEQAGRVEQVEKKVQKNIPYGTTQPAGTPSNISPETYEFINNTIINKVVQLCLDLQRETDQGRIKQQMEAIESGTRALKNLR